ncbi:SA1362 family protein [Evansella cellulosilytica]|uniref:Uncharacterized protein n=1 Tax=Evansella cellulosilytica (strain ATCC 21833 / DSM 2522 / FERM P-1141 / JCM 9156 / N-4) TaxID=649639 RepID=E6TXN2_EVAC2|nr:SA1362 family protein [Evansella cellulosilytica]ADU29958.1 hypothetical protein Bcell_1695 [Evansella cellulosilytica DSM 2522]
MLRNSFHPLTLTIIGLAIIGIGYRLVENPSAFFTMVLVAVGTATILIFVMKRFILPKLSGYQTAMRPQSAPSHKSQHGQKPISFKSMKKEKKKRISRPLVKRQSNVKLTVIEGKKNKKKNRALF